MFNAHIKTFTTIDRAGYPDPVFKLDGMDNSEAESYVAEYHSQYFNLLWKFEVYNLRLLHFMDFWGFQYAKQNYVGFVGYHMKSLHIL